MAAGSALGAEGVLEGEAVDGAGEPGVVAERAAAGLAGVEAVEFLGGQGGVDGAGPVVGAGDGPVIGEDAAEVREAFRGGRGGRGGAGVEAGPGPVLGAAAEVGGEGVALDVAAGGEEVVVTLDREGLEAALVEGPWPTVWRATRQRMAWVLASQRQKAVRSPSWRGRATTCQWLGMRQKAKRSIGWRAWAWTRVRAKAA